MEFEQHMTVQKAINKYNLLISERIMEDLSEKFSADMMKVRPMETKDVPSQLSRDGAIAVAKYEKISSEILLQTTKTIADAVQKASDLQKVVDILQHSHRELLCSLKELLGRFDFQVGILSIVSKEMVAKAREAVKNAEEI